VSDLHHWDDAEAFSAQEAAALVVGIDPLDPQAPLWKAGPVLERMKEAHKIARAFVTQVMTPAEFAMQRELRNWADALVSVLFDNYPMLQKNPWPSDPNRPYELLTRFAGPDGEFQVQKFARAEIQRWLSVVGIRSAYQFDRKQLNAGPLRLTPAPPEVPVLASGGMVELDYSVLATPAALLDAFKQWGLKVAWFDELDSHKWLLDARRQKGQGQRGHAITPMFCPYAVMCGLMGGVRKATRLNPVTAWRTLEHKFPKVHAAFESHDPRDRTGD